MDHSYGPVQHVSRGYVTVSPLAKRVSRQYCPRARQQCELAALTALVEASPTTYLHCTQNISPGAVQQHVIVTTVQHIIVSTVIALGTSSPSLPSRFPLFLSLS
eukprot:scpid110533/ scgid26675/ 